MLVKWSSGRDLKEKFIIALCLFVPEKLRATYSRFQCSCLSLLQNKNPSNTILHNFLLYKSERQVDPLNIVFWKTWRKENYFRPWADIIFDWFNMTCSNWYQWNIGTGASNEHRPAGQFIKYTVLSFKSDNIFHFTTVYKTTYSQLYHVNEDS